jgi:hypothetical protein
MLLAIFRERRGINITNGFQYASILATAKERRGGGIKIGSLPGEEGMRCLLTYKAISHAV